MREALEPFANVGTSNVFFQVVLGRTTPSEVAEALETQPPSVVEHLNKLRERGIVDRGDKDGKYQPYEINWKKFLSEFLNHTSTLEIQEAVIKSEKNEEARKELEQEHESLKEILGELKRNEQFRKLVQGYIEGVANDMHNKLYPKRTVWGAIYCFEESLGSVASIKDKVKDQEMVKVLDLLEKWGWYIQRFKDHGPKAALRNSVLVAEGGPR